MWSELPRTSRVLLLVYCVLVTVTLSGSEPRPRDSKERERGKEKKKNFSSGYHAIIALLKLMMNGLVHEA